jgi:hypothetical protein
MATSKGSEMAGLPQKDTPRIRQMTDGEPLADLIQGLDASAADLRLGRIESLDGLVEEMEAELEAHLARQSGTTSRI